MIEKLFKYLHDANVPVSAPELVTKILGIQGANPVAAAQIVRSLVNQDVRFRENEPGFWSLASLEYIKPVKSDQDLICEFFPLAARSLEAIGSAMIYPTLETNGPRIEIQKSSLAQFARQISEILTEHAGQLLFVSGFTHAKRFVTQLHFIARQKEPEINLISVRRLAQRLYPDHSFTTFDRLCQFFHNVHRSSEEPTAFMDDLRSISQCLRQELKNRGLDTQDEILKFCYSPPQDIDFSSYSFDRSFLDNLPPQPGVYIMKDRQNQVIYVGKAKNLARRLKSYFFSHQRPDAKCRSILERIFAIEIELVGSELEALIREFTLIQQYKPDINRQLKIHNRKFSPRFYQKRIFILPASSPSQVSLVFLAQSGATRQIFAEKNYPDQKKLGDEIEAFFYQSQETAHKPDPDGMILLSWLRQNADKVNWVEIELAETRAEVMRQLLLHIQSFAPNAEKTIYR